MSDTELKELYQQAKEKSGLNDIEMIMVILLTIGGKENVEKILKEHSKQEIVCNCIRENK